MHHIDIPVSNRVQNRPLAIASHADHWLCTSVKMRPVTLPAPQYLLFSQPSRLAPQLGTRARVCRVRRSLVSAGLEIERGEQSHVRPLECKGCRYTDSLRSYMKLIMTHGS